jgi:hypothetical protein
MSLPKGIRAIINTLFPLVEKQTARADGKKGLFCDYPKYDLRRITFLSLE